MKWEKNILQVDYYGYIFLIYLIFYLVKCCVFALMCVYHT